MFANVLFDSEAVWFEDFTSYLWQVTMDGTCESSGATNGPDGWFAILGRNIITQDDFGFVTRGRYLNADHARTAYERMCRDYEDWSHECESSCYVCGSHNHCGCVCGYCDVCADYHPADERFGVQCQHKANVLAITPTDRPHNI